MKKYKTIIPRREEVSDADWFDGKWQQRHSLHTLGQLALLSGAPQAPEESLRALLRRYPFRITPYYLSLMDPQDADDPVRKQCFPHIDEMDPLAGGEPDPLEEDAHMPVPGLVHRYRDRCLVIVTNVCAVYCRHCNRKRRWENGFQRSGKAQLRNMADYIAGTKVIREVIVSGGDPLTMNVELLDWFLGELRRSSHVEVIRIGSRLPVVMPMGITEEICAVLRRHRPLWFNTQFNHAREITEDAARACAMLLDAGIPLSNQSVLLKGINDNYASLEELFYGLQRLGVRPYYLFQCDNVAGANHFSSAAERGTQIMRKLRENISGLCLPRYVVDTPRGKREPA